MYQTIMLYTLEIHDVVSQSYLDKAGGEKKRNQAMTGTQVSWPRSSVSFHIKSSNPLCYL